MLILIACVIVGVLIGSFVAWLERRLPVKVHICIGIVVGGLLGWFLGNLFW